MQDEYDRTWWERMWNEREDAMWRAYGPSQPPGSPEGYVVSFDFRETKLPGSCAGVFPPNLGDEFKDIERRDYWLYAGNGLAQFLTRKELEAARTKGSRLSGCGYEFAIIVDEPASWAPGLLKWLMTYVRSVKAINRGDRFPFCFTSLEPNGVKWAIGGSGEDDDDDPCVDSTRALVFWPYLSRHAAFTTSSGSWEMRIATTVTGAEWELAKITSSCHLLLLLDWAGIGQRTVPGRSCVTEQPGWERVWSILKTLPFDDAKAGLSEIAKKKRKVAPPDPTAASS
jgi:hypothetical protein